MTRQVEEVSPGAPALVARNLRIAQAIARLSNTELAEATGVTPRAVGRWRRGDVEIPLSALERVARVLGREPAWFLTDHETEAAA